MKRIYLLICLLGILTVVHAQQTKILTAEKHNEYGLIYTLPITALQIEFTVEKKVSKTGPFYKYANVFLSDKKVVENDETSFSITSVKVTPYGIPDPDNRYLMQLKAGATTFIGVAEDGMLLTINKEPSQQISSKQKDLVSKNPSYTGKEYLEFVNEDFTSAKSDYKKAQLLAEEIMEVREAKLSLTRGTAETMPTDGKQLEIMLENLDKQEKALTQAFTGFTILETQVRSFTYIPEEEGTEVICRLSNLDGLVEPEDLSGSPIYINVKITEEASLPVDTKGEEKKLPKDAVVYNIPGFADVTITYKSNVIYQKNYPFSQYGMTFGLNPAIFTDKKEPSYAIFDPSTGALLELGTLK